MKPAKSAAQARPTRTCTGPCPATPAAAEGAGRPADLAVETQGWRRGDRHDHPGARSHERCPHIRAHLEPGGGSGDHCRPGALRRPGRHWNRYALDHRLALDCFTLPAYRNAYAEITDLAAAGQMVDVPHSCRERLDAEDLAAVDSACQNMSSARELSRLRPAVARL
ncbi:MAG: hypothetical protein IPK63_23825 [Candidatus Competibacteraceae bacterium]|nr:hypothetical protein [Candidatus Competibacteraceae bacterium]